MWRGGGGGGKKGGKQKKKKEGKGKRIFKNPKKFQYLNKTICE